MPHQNIFNFESYSGFSAFMRNLPKTPETCTLVLEAYSRDPNRSGVLIKGGMVQITKNR